MGKVLDPIVVNPKKEQAVKPFERKDIEKFAYDVLADLGDEVINKAIEEGKIVLPQNIDVEKLPVIGTYNSNNGRYEPTISFEDWEKIKWNCLRINAASGEPYVVLYPSQQDEEEDDVVYYLGVHIGDGGDVLGVFNSNKTWDGKLSIHEDKHILSNIPDKPVMSALYFHSIKMELLSGHTHPKGITKIVLGIVAAESEPLEDFFGLKNIFSPAYEQGFISIRGTAQDSSKTYVLMNIEYTAGNWGIEPGNLYFLSSDDGTFLALSDSENVITDNFSFTDTVTEL